MARTGSTLAVLSREFEPKAQSIHTGMEQTDQDEDRRNDGLATEERKKSVRLSS